MYTTRGGHDVGDSHDDSRSPSYGLCHYRNCTVKNPLSHASDNP